ncbi:MAG: glycosyltransferase family 39 protein, partial [Candidatus Binatia bacterium]
LFTLGAILLLTSAVSRIRGRAQGFLAGILLIGTPYFITHGISQYSDIPLAFFFLASFAAAALHDWDQNQSPKYLVLAGVMAGLAAWTKNEGLLFIAAFFLARFGVKLRRQGPRTACRELFLMGAGLLPVLAVVFYVKTQLYAPQTILETRGIPYNFGNFLDLSRYLRILFVYKKKLIEFGHWPLSLPVLLVFYGLWIGASRSRRTKAAGGSMLLTLLFMLGGYFVVFLSTPHSLGWHLRTSIDRLFLCLWPSFLLAYFLIVKTPNEAVQAAPAGEPEFKTETEMETRSQACI